MEGFYCAKLHIGKPQKGKLVCQCMLCSITDRWVWLTALPSASKTAQKDTVEQDIAEAPEVEEEPSMAFDETADAALIEEGRIKKLKRKGIKVVDPEIIKAKKQKKADKVKAQE